MKFLVIAAIAVLSIFGFVMLIFHIKSRRPLRSILLNAAIGLLALTIINLTTRFTGVHIPVNWWSAGGSAIFGIPAVCTLVVLQLLI